MCLCHQTTVMLYGWAGNCRYGIALAMRHRLSGIHTYGLSGLGKGHSFSFDYGTGTFTTSMRITMCWGVNSNTTQSTSPIYMVWQHLKKARSSLPYESTMAWEGLCFFI